MRMENVQPVTGPSKILLLREAAKRGHHHDRVLLLQDSSAIHRPCDLSTRSKNPSAPKCPEPTFMQHYQVPPVEYSSYINHVISLGWLRTTLHNCMPAAPQTAPLPSERPLIKPADTCLEW